MSLGTHGYLRPFKDLGGQDNACWKPMNFNVTEWKLIDSVSLSILQLFFKKLPFVEFWCSGKEEYIQLSERLLKYSVISWIQSR